MNRLFVFLAVLLSFQSLSAQNINFSKGNWIEMLVKSKTENKLIFVDIYAVWCGPCKAMAKNVFTQAVVADKYNSSFVNYMIDAEKGEGIKLAERYKVESFPTYLFIDSDASIVYKIEGALTAAKFNEEADKVLKKYKGGK